MLCSCWTLSLVSSFRSSLRSQGALLVRELSKRDSLLLAWTFSRPTNTLHCHLQVNLKQLDSRLVGCHWGAHVYVCKCVLSVRDTDSRSPSSAISSNLALHPHFWVQHRRPHLNGYHFYFTFILPLFYAALYLQLKRGLY